MVKLDMVLFFYDCQTTKDPSSIDAYLFDEWDGLEVCTSKPVWQNHGTYSRDLCVDLVIKIDGYQALDYIYKALYVCANDLIKTWDIHDKMGGMPAYNLYFNPYAVYADRKIPGEER